MLTGVQDIMPALVHCLPDDVLGEIFMELRHMLTPVSNPHSTWRLSLVCTRWRNITQSYPLLWSRIGILLKPNCEVILRHYLEHSQGTPLSISITNSPSTKLKVEWTAREALFDILRSSMNRWREFDISNAPCAINSTYVYRLFTPGITLDRLERLVAPHFNVLSRCPALLTATRLHTLHIADLNISPDGDLMFPFDQIDNLTVATRDQLSVGLQKQLLPAGETIAAFPYARHVTILPVLAAGVAPYSATLTNITSLTFLFKEGYWGAIGPHVSGLVLPALVELRIVGRGNMQIPDVLGRMGAYAEHRSLGPQWLFAFLRNLVSPLRMVMFDNILFQFWSTGFHDLLMCMPDLTHLIVREPVDCNVFVTDVVLRLLTRKPSFLPALRGVELLWRLRKNPGHVDELAVVKMLEARRFACATVGNFRPHNLGPRAKDAYTRLRRDGLEYFHYP